MHATRVCFGPGQGPPGLDYRQVPTPVGQPCAWCGEPFTADDCGIGERRATPGSTVVPLLPVYYHAPCWIRTQVGPVGCLAQRCGCFGGTDGDPEGLTPREAAQAAADLWAARERGDTD